MRNYFAIFRESATFESIDIELVRDRIYRLRENVLSVLCEDCVEKSKKDTEDFVYGESIYEAYKTNFLLYNDVYKNLIKQLEGLQRTTFRKRMVHDIFRKDDFKEHFYTRYPIFRTFEGEI